MAKPIPPPDVPLLEIVNGKLTGRIAQVWYEFLLGFARGSTATTGGGNSTSVWFYGSTVPASSLGVDGDFHIQTSGTSIVAFRVKSGGVW